MYLRDGKIAIEIDLKKVLIVAVMVASTVLSCATGMGDALLVIIPAGVACLISKEV